MNKNIIINIRKNHKNKTIGFTCSCFDLLHAGHYIMLKDAKEQCDILVIGLQTDPTLDINYRIEEINMQWFMMAKYGKLKIRKI